MAAAPVKARQTAVTRWVIYALVAAAVVAPFVVPMPMPFTPLNESKALYDQLDALKPGDHVLLAFDYDPASQVELTPMARGLLLHCFKKGVVPIVMTFWSTGLNIHKETIESAAQEAREKYGKEIQSGRDFVFLGFRTGGAQVLLKMGENVKGTFEKDFYGKPTANMAGLKGLTSIKDLKLAVDLAAGATPQTWIAYGSDRFGFPLGVGCTAVQAPDMYPFIQSHQVVGMLGGLRGAADYEKLLDAPGSGMRGMQSQSLTHLLIIGLIIVANVALIVGLTTRRRKD